MNNAQLDMVLGYLNEGTEIDEISFLTESINDLIFESNMFENLLEGDVVDFPNKNEDNSDEDSKKSAPEKTNKVKELIKRFLNWIKKLIVNLKGLILKISAKLKKSALSKNLDKVIKKLEETKADNYLIDNKDLANIMFIDSVSKSSEFSKIITTFNKLKNINGSNLDSAGEIIDKQIEFLNNNLKQYKENKDYKIVGNTEKTQLPKYLNKIKSGGGVEKLLDLPNQILEYYNATYKNFSTMKVDDPAKVNEILSKTTKLCNISLNYSTSIIKGVNSFFNFCTKALKTYGAVDTDNGKASNLSRTADKEITQAVKSKEKWTNNAK